MQGDATTAYRLRIVLRRAYQTIESFDKYVSTAWLPMDALAPLPLQQRLHCNSHVHTARAHWMHTARRLYHCCI